MKVAILTLTFVVVLLFANATKKNDDDNDTDFYLKSWKAKTRRCPNIVTKKYLKMIKKRRENVNKENLIQKLKNNWCPEPDNIDNGKVKYRCGLGIGQKAVYRCNAGFRLVPKECKKRFCMLDKAWSGEPPICIKDCGMPEAPSNGNVTLDHGQTLFGNKSSYSCNPGYTLEGGSTSRVCDLTGWTGKTPCCMKDCEALTDPQDGVVIQNGMAVGAKAKYVCKTGYHMTGPRFRYCLHTGNWSGKKPTCRPFDCGVPEDPCHGTANLDNGTTTLNSTVSYSCNPRFILSGGPRVCQLTGWTGQKPCCIKGLCDPNPCLNGATCTQSETQSYTCNCQPGYFGERCENVFDCDFDNGLCSWIQSGTDDIDWTTKNGPTFSSYTGPNQDHTSGNGNFLYIEASHQKDNSTADLLSPLIPSGQTFCMNLAYHMYGSCMGVINVYAKNEASGAENKIKTLTQPMINIKSWHTASITISPQASTFRVVIEGMRGTCFRSDAAIDDVRIRQGSC